jgi:hypothetical protein
LELREERNNDLGSVQPVHMAVVAGIMFDVKVAAKPNGAIGTPA